VIFNVNFKTFSILIYECICWCMNFIDIKMHGTMIKNSSATCLQEPHIWCYAIQILISTYAFEYHRFQFYFFKYNNRVLCLGHICYC